MRVRRLVVGPCLAVMFLGVSGRLSSTSPSSAHAPRPNVNYGAFPSPLAPKNVASTTQLHKPILEVGAVGSTSHGSAHSSTARGPGLSLAVDGAKNPERVPTNLAYRHFIYVSALRVGASEREIVRRDSFLARVGLSEADRSAYVAAVQNVAEQLADVEARLEANGDATQVDSLRQQQRNY